jgi:multicomponent Na+:H+ antiporter subunit D
MIHIVLAKSTLFLVSGVVHRLRGTYELKKLGGLYRARPDLALLFFLPAMSLAGIPPFSGFFAKLALVKAGLQSSQYAIVTTALAVSLLTLYSMIKIWTEAFWKDAPLETVEEPAEASYFHSSNSWRPVYIPIVALTLLIVTIGLIPEPLFLLATRTAEQLLDLTTYIQTVLGGSL